MADEPQSQNTTEAVGTNLTRAELNAAWEIPATLVNKVVLSMSGPNARLAFLETTTPPAAGAVMGRAAVLMTIGDLLELRDLIASMTANLKLIRVDASEENKDG